MLHNNNDDDDDDDDTVVITITEHGVLMESVTRYRERM